MTGPLVGLYLLFIVLSLIQQPGHTTYDTRAELTESPGSFLSGAFTLWHPAANFGELQNQAYGYLFPQGPWFLLTELLQMPDWISQRLWSALLLIVACEGARRVARACGLTPAGALLAGLAFALSPRLLGTDGVITGETLASAMLPWALLPVLLHLRGRLSGWQAAILSGAAVACMGGVNAVEVAAALPVVFIVVVWGVVRGLARRRFAAQWAGVVALASLWWALPLLVLARFAPPFYEYVESAANTTSLIGWSEAVRGDDHWVAYLTSGTQPWWPGAHYLATNPTMVVVAGAVSAFGLWGLTRLGNGLRVPLAIAAMIGLMALTVAHGGWAGAPVAGWFRSAFDGSLQIFRNVHKIDPTVRLPIAIGFGQASVVAVGWLTTRWRSLEPARPLLVAVPLLLVLSMFTPFVLNQVRTPGWSEIPDHWTDAQAYLAEHDDGRATLLAPGTGFAQQYWGWTLDEPLLVLGGTSLAVRSQAPIIPGQSIRYLSSLDQLVSTGRATDDLPDALARAGIGHVIVRRDLDRSLTSSLPPAGASLSALTAGLTRVASFGTYPDGSSPIEIYAVAATQPRLRATAAADAVTVSGAPEAVLGLDDLVGSAATVSAGEDGWTKAPDIVTDSYQRRERNFGEINDGVSAVLSADEPWRVHRAAHDYPVAPDAKPVVARYAGLSSLEASSSRGFADTFGKVLPEFAPYAAIDGDPDTRWLSSPGTDPRDQWIRMNFDEPRSVTTVRILPVQDPSAAVLRSLEVVAGDQHKTVQASSTGGAVTVDFDGSEVGSLTIRVAGVSSAGGDDQMGLREVTVAGFTPDRTYVVPDPVGRSASWRFQARPDQRACLPSFGLPECDTGRIRTAEEATGMDRTFETPDGHAETISGQVIARSTPDADALLDPLDSTQTVTATSVYGDDPKASARFAYDGLPETAWISSAEDTGPALRFAWKQRHRITGLSIDLGSDFSRPVTAVLRYNNTFQRVRLLSDTMVPVDAFRTKKLSVSVLPSAPGLPVEVADIRLDGFDVIRKFDPETPTGAVCGLGPVLQLDAGKVNTRVTGTMGDVLNGVPLELTGCWPGSTHTAAGQAGSERVVVLSPGWHQLKAPPTSTFRVTELTGTSTSSGLRAVPASEQARSVELGDWSASSRSATVGTGDAALLSLPENFNDGWTAEVDGHSLDAVRVDGWRQGWVLPADAAGDLHIEFGPQRTYTITLVVGLAISGLVVLAGLALLVLLTFGAGRNRSGGRASEFAWPTRSGSVRTAAVAVPVLLVFAGPAGAVGAASTIVAGRRRARAMLVLAAAGGLLVLGSAVLDVTGHGNAARQLADLLAALGVGLIVGCCLMPTGPDREEGST